MLETIKDPGIIISNVFQRTRESDLFNPSHLLRALRKTIRRILSIASNRMKFLQIVVSTMSKNIRKIHIGKNSYLSFKYAIILISILSIPKFQKFHWDPKCNKIIYTDLLITIRINRRMMHIDIIEILIPWNKGSTNAFKFHQSPRQRRIRTRQSPRSHFRAAGNTESSQLFSGLRKI